MLQEKYGSITDSFFRSAQAAFIVYDVTSKATFDNVRRWAEQVRGFHPHIPIAVIGNKCDLIHVVPTQTAIEFCEARDFAFWETSALDGTSVALSFESFVKTVKLLPPAPASIGSLIIAAAPPRQPRFGGWC